ncbi:2-aminoethanethiol dioxygenase [Phlebotomus argentipes]|uniref:2-aminoethanethiol dioxygenase n=1 Tax=Phlebotomus argentipes TaxID=94469 RepID=UPI002892E543|nr:2-aminoethanethiol dioxygenase [Phlebotomus argentipes]
MSVHFAKIVQQARLTFDQRNVIQFASNFSCLQRLMDELKLEDIQVSPEVVSKRSFNVPEKAPCTFIHIYECPVFSMSVFILAENYTMPLHDHPLMHGILKCISGCVRVQSFSSIKDEPPSGSVAVQMSQPKQLDASSPAAILTPKENNFHEITAIPGGGPGAFFDILSPPYDSPLPAFGKRKCSFYRKTQGLAGDLILERIPTPLHYYCDNVLYDPPQFLKDNQA